MFVMLRMLATIDWPKEGENSAMLVATGAVVNRRGAAFLSYAALHYTDFNISTLPAKISITTQQLTIEVAVAHHPSSRRD